MSKTYGKDYVVPMGEEELAAAAKKYQITMGQLATDNEFLSSTITVGGVVYGVGERHREVWLDQDSEDEEEPTLDFVGLPGIRGAHLRHFNEIAEQIKGLYCPDCDSQAFRTDQPNVAVCGSYPGWYFFYKKLDNTESAKTKLVIRNGELVSVDASEVTQDVD